MPETDGHRHPNAFGISVENARGWFIIFLALGLYLWNMAQWNSASTETAKQVALLESTISRMEEAENARTVNMSERMSRAEERLNSIDASMGDVRNVLFGTARDDHRRK